MTERGSSSLDGARAKTAPLLRVNNLAVSFANARGPRLRAVDGVRMSIFPGQTLAVVGESGCGKSVTAMSLLQLIPRPPARFDRGSAIFDNGQSQRDLLTLGAADIRDVRGNEIAMIFQEPMTSLNPVLSVGDQVCEAIRLHQRVSRADAVDIAVRAMTEVRIPDPASRLREYPHQFSGGMRQRVMIAMALACQPRLLLADEPTTALDVTVQAQILELLSELQQTRGMSIMLITHDLGVVAHNADVVCVMYAGRVVEYASVERLFQAPLHPYTRGLFNSIPSIAARRDRLQTIADHIDDSAEFPPIASSSGHTLRPWWPWHSAPRDLAATPEQLHADPSADYLLVEAAPQHWIGAWRTREIVGIPARFPEIHSSARAG